MVVLYNVRFKDSERLYALYPREARAPLNERPLVLVNETPPCASRVGDFRDEAHALDLLRNYLFGEIIERVEVDERPGAGGGERG